MDTTETRYKSEIPPTPTPLLPPPKSDNLGLDVVLRVLLFAATLTALVVMVTSKQTELVTVAGVPVPVSVDAKFNYSPALIYFVAAMATACLWSIISTLSSLSVISKPVFAIKFDLFCIVLDVLILGVVAAATGAAGGVSYIGYKGNKHTGWAKVCNVYDKYCRHVAASLGLSLFASVLLVLLILLSALSLRNRIPPPAY